MAERRRWRRRALVALGLTLLLVALWWWSGAAERSARARLLAEIASEAPDGLDAAWRRWIVIPGPPPPDIDDPLIVAARAVEADGASTLLQGYPERIHWLEVAEVERSRLWLQQHAKLFAAWDRHVLVNGKLDVSPYWWRTGPALAWHADPPDIEGWWAAQRGAIGPCAEIGWVIQLDAIVASAPSAALRRSDQLMDAWTGREGDWNTADNYELYHRTYLHHAVAGRLTRSDVERYVARPFLGCWLRAEQLSWTRQAEFGLYARSLMANRITRTPTNWWHIWENWKSRSALYDKILNAWRRNRAEEAAWRGQLDEREHVAISQAEVGRVLSSRRAPAAVTLLVDLRHGIPLPADDAEAQLRIGHHLARSAQLPRDAYRRIDAHTFEFFVPHDEPATTLWFGSELISGHRWSPKTSYTARW